MTGRRTHGHTSGGKPSPTYKSWMAMMARCTNPASTNYALYGARGISVCQRWLTFENFLADVGERPAGMTIDRINADGNYEPGNVRWATAQMQTRNRRGNLLLTFDGRTQPLFAWAEERGLTRDVLRKRLRLGWSIQRALTEPRHAYHDRRGQ